MHYTFSFGVANNIIALEEGWRVGVKKKKKVKCLSHFYYAPRACISNVNM